MAIVEARDLTKVFDGQSPAVDNLDLVTEEGEYLVLLGPSGSGKSTLLRLIAGLEQPTSGEIYIAGEPMAGLPPRARSIAMVFQSYALYPHKTVYDNIVFPLKAQGFESADRPAKVEWAADLLGIGHLLKRKPRQLSGGERQRVALARALVREPSVFLLDEPLSNLDAKLRGSARDELRTFQKRIGVTTLYVTHDQVEAMGLGDRIAVLNDGTIRQIGTPEEVYGNPADTFVATFVGSPPMNLIRRGDVIVGFRPESMLPASERSGEGLTLAVDVQRVEYLGSERHVLGTVSGDDRQNKVTGVLPAALALEVAGGKDQDFFVPETDLRFFDADSGERTDPRPYGL
ncbi:MAG: ABC transporter ATP-binding protein [Actinomycetota bacterium]